MSRSSRSKGVNRARPDRLPTLEPAVIKEMAEELRRARVEKINVDGIQLVVYEPIGEEWVERFIGRHPLLKRARVQKIERLRVKEIYHEDVIEWFNELDELIRECKSRGRTFITWMKPEALLERFRRSMSSLIKWNKRTGKLNLGGRNGLLWWSAFVPMDLRSRR